MKKRRLYKTQNISYEVDILNPKELTEKDISAWQELEENTIETNAFLSPNFVLPAVRHLEGNSNVHILFVNRKIHGVSMLVGVFIFKIKKFGRFFPLPHISAYRSCHSYQTGILAEKNYAQDVVQIIFKYFREFPNLWPGIVFEDRLLNGPMAALEEDIAAEMGMTWVSYMQWERSVLFPRKLKDGALSLSKKLQKNFERRLRRLDEMGAVEWRFLAGDEIESENVDELIRLENLGWKGENQSSIHSHQEYERFFREMIDNFVRKQRIFYTELRLNDKIISSTSNLISGETGFAFKLGWDPEYAKWAPGILNILLLSKCDDERFKKMNHIDSCANPSSFINEIWSDKIMVGDGVFVNSKLGDLLYSGLPGVQYAKKVKQKIF